MFICVTQHRNWPLRSTIRVLNAHGTNTSSDGLCTRTHNTEAFSCWFCCNSFRVDRARRGSVCLEDQAKACAPTDQPAQKFKDDLGITMTMKMSLFSGQSDIFLPVQQYKHVVGSPPRGARSGGHDSCQAARTAATCT